jgi:hypothetical protein
MIHSTGLIGVHSIYESAARTLDPFVLNLLAGNRGHGGTRDGMVRQLIGTFANSVFRANLSEYLPKAEFLAQSP